MKFDPALLMKMKFSNAKPESTFTSNKKIKKSNSYDVTGFLQSTLKSRLNDYKSSIDILEQQAMNLIISISAKYNQATYNKLNEIYDFLNSHTLSIWKLAESTKHIHQILFKQNVGPPHLHPKTPRSKSDGSFNKIYSLLDHSHKSYMQQLQKNDKKRKTAKYLRPIEVEAFERDAKLNMRPEELIQKYGISRSSVVRKLKQLKNIGAISQTVKYSRQQLKMLKNASQNHLENGINMNMRNHLKMVQNEYNSINQLQESIDEEFDQLDSENLDQIAQYSSNPHQYSNSIQHNSQTNAKKSQINIKHEVHDEADFKNQNLA